MSYRKRERQIPAIQNDNSPGREKSRNGVAYPYNHNYIDRRMYSDILTHDQGVKKRIRLRKEKVLKLRSSVTLIKELAFQQRVYRYYIIALAVT